MALDWKCQNNKSYVLVVNFLKLNDKSKEKVNIPEKKHQKKINFTKEETLLNMW